MTFLTLFKRVYHWSERGESESESSSLIIYLGLPVGKPFTVYLITTYTLLCDGLLQLHHILYFLMTSFFLTVIPFCLFLLLCSDLLDGEGAAAFSSHSACGVD